MLKDVFRPELMDAVKIWQKANRASRKIYWQTHDTINQRLQGLMSKEIKERNGFAQSVLIRDHYEARPLIDYAAINRLAANLIKFQNMHPVDAVNQACDLYLTPDYVPEPVPIVENIYKADKKLQAKKRERELAPVTQASSLHLNPIN